MLTMHHVASRRRLEASRRLALLKIDAIVVLTLPVAGVLESLLAVVLRLLCVCISG